MTNTLYVYIIAEVKFCMHIYTAWLSDMYIYIYIYAGTLMHAYIQLRYNMYVAMQIKCVGCIINVLWCKHWLCWTIMLRESKMKSIIFTDMTNLQYSYVAHELP